MPGVYTVTQMNSYIKNMFRQDFVLSRISVKGEVSNCKYHTSGHIYFSLKDGQGVMSAIMFAGSAKNLEFRLENGMQVIVSGRIDVYERDGKYQLYANAIEADGQGDLYKQFEALKKSYEEMGYFSPEYKRPIPSFSRRIGIVTAATGAAGHDIMNISYRRNPFPRLDMKLILPLPILWRTYAHRRHLRQQSWQSVIFLQLKRRLQHMKRHCIRRQCVRFQTVKMYWKTTDSGWLFLTR